MGEQEDAWTGVAQQSHGTIGGKVTDGPGWGWGRGCDNGPGTCTVLTQQEHVVGSGGAALWSGRGHEGQGL